MSYYTRYIVLSLTSLMVVFGTVKIIYWAQYNLSVLHLQVNLYSTITVYQPYMACEIEPQVGIGP